MGAHECIDMIKSIHYKAVGRKAILLCYSLLLHYSFMLQLYEKILTSEPQCLCVMCRGLHSSLL